MKDSVTLSIVSYNQKHLLQRCLNQLQSLGLPADWKTIVVDNQSQDGSADMVEKYFPSITLYRSNENLGFGKGHNLAYQNSTGNYFIVLNADIMVLRGSIEAMLSEFENHSKAAVIGPCLLNPDQTMQYSARRFYTWSTVLLRRCPFFNFQNVHDHHLMKDCDLTRLQKVDWVMGAAMGIRREAFPGNDLFDRRYVLYFEDVDLCYFIQKQGWDVLYCPSSRMIHDHQRASAKGLINKATLIHFSSWLKFRKKAKQHDKR